jgi:hypothetical protein
MRRPLWLGALGLAALALALAAAAGMPAVGQALPAGPLDGRIFAATTGETGKTSAEKDELIFKDRTFRSVACDPYGFGSAPYTATKNADGSMAFAATTSSPKEGTIRWQGKVQGEAIAGTYVWEKAGQKPISYWFKGSLRKAA